MNEDLTMTKLAYYRGQANTLRAIGLTEDQIKLAFEEQGLTKEAIWGVLGKGLMAAGKGLGKLFAGGVSKAGLKGAPSVLQANKLLGEGALTGIKALKPGAKAVATGWKPGLGQRISESFISAGRGLSGDKPLQALWGGAKEFGKGMMFSPHARGLGAGLGKGFAGYQIGSMLLGPGGSPTPQPMQRPPMYGGY